MTKENIWLFKQNRPSLIADDLEKFGVPRLAVHETLLRRGCYKWLAARRDIIKLKDQIKAELRKAHAEVVKYPRGSKERERWRGRIETMEWIRTAIRQITHSERWRAPDIDREAQDFLEYLERATIGEAPEGANPS